jgi:hypothetical protein
MKVFNQSKNSAAQIADLENRVAEAARSVAQARQSHRGARERYADAQASLDEAPDSAALAASVGAAQGELQARSADLEAALQALADAERKLVATREAPQRQETARKLRHAADRLSTSIATAQLAIAQLVEGINQAWFPDFVPSVTGAALFAQIVGNCDSALTSSDGTNLVAELRKRAAAVIDGNAPAGLQPSAAEMQAALKKAG